MAASRTKNSIKNTIFSLANYLLKVVLLFAVRTVFIWKLGSEYLGLNSLFSNILTILSLAETGFGSAIVFALYKPTAENDTEKINALLKIYKKFYNIVAIIVLVLGLIILPFLPYLISGQPDVEINIYLVYFIYLLNTVVSYFCAHRRAVLYTNQRNDVESKISSIGLIFVNGFQILALCLFANYYAYCIIIVLGTVLESALVFFATRKMYPYINLKTDAKISQGEKKDLTKNTYSLFLHKIGGIFVTSTDSIIISAYLGLTILGIYSNYLLIYTSLTTITTLLLNAVKGSIGNLVATKSTDEVEKTQNKLVFAYNWFISFCTICLFCLYQPFIKTWLGTDYLLKFSVVICICVNFYFYTSRNMINGFKEATGLFYYDRYRSLIEGIVNLVASLILVQFMGLEGVIIGTIISTITACYWVEPVVLYKHYYKKSPKKYFLKALFYMVVTTAITAVLYFIISFIPDGSIWWLILKFAVCIVLSNVLLILAYLPTKEFKEWFALIKDALKGLKNRIKIKKQQEINVDEDKQDKIKEEGQLEEPLNNLTSNDSNEMRDAENDLDESQDEIKNKVNQPDESQSEIKNKANQFDEKQNEIKEQKNEIVENQYEIKEEKVSSNINIDINE